MKKVVRLVDHDHKKCQDQLEYAKEMKWTSIMIIGTTQEGLVETFFMV